MSRRGVRNTADGIQVVDLPDDDSEGVRVRVASAGICATDLWLISQGPLPFVLGHEFAGVLDDGTPVAVYPLTACNDCDQCAQGAANRCRRMFEASLGFGADGGMCEELIVPESALTRVPDGLSPRDGVLVEPLAVATHALTRVDLQGGQRVAVVGAGSLGLLVAAVAADAGCEVAIVARHRHQEAASERLGVSRNVAGEYDVVVDAAGSESGLARCQELIAPGGTLLMLGVYSPAGVTFPAFPLLIKEAKIVTSTAYCYTSAQNDFQAAAAFLGRHPEVAQAVITHRFGLEDASSAFATAADRTHGAIKVVIDPR
jgi:2-desacetyl-2-hydroxyethyl bacteriochlorophyllide A dehydrogenase